MGHKRFYKKNILSPGKNTILREEEFEGSESNNTFKLILYIIVAIICLGVIIFL
jgi:hypothetical protein